MQNNIGYNQRKTYSVSMLNSKIKALLEQSFPIVWINGEISNFSAPRSGHFYFTLKDEASQISAVIFRGQNRNLRFMPENGMKITGLGRLSLYEPRGTYQVIFEYLEPEGVGALQIAFEQLKARLAAKGYFDAGNKSPLPSFPQVISVITSPTGAVIHDIIKVSVRRFPNIRIEVLPVRVQGEGADREIVSALEFLNERKRSDVIILARGGGSLEDLSAFNSEIVAHAIYSSSIPVVSAVGHETDFSIADFVADVRAPTPSAAAEIAVPEKKAIQYKIASDSERLHLAMTRRITGLQERLHALTRRLVDPRRRVDDFRLRTDDYTKRLTRSMNWYIEGRRELLRWRIERLYANNPALGLKNMEESRKALLRRLISAMEKQAGESRASLKELVAKLFALNPKAILDRGYSITRTIPGAAVVTDSRNVHTGQELEILLARGSIICSVAEKLNDD